MASTLASSTSSLHRDMRSGEKPFKRDRELSAKWAHGIRGANSINALTHGTQFPGGAPHNYKERPQKKWSDVSKHHKSNTTFNRGNADSRSKAGRRMAAKNDCTFESANTTSLSKSLIDLLPAATPLYPSSHGRGASDGLDSITYSFDAARGPGHALGLEGLVEKAEKEWLGKETDRIVKKEWEVLDNEGEATGLRTKSKKSPEQKPILVVDEDDWECL